MKKLLLIAGSASCLLFAGCASNPGPQMTQLQVRQLQTKSYTTTDTIMVMKGVVNALQDMGFTVTNADNQLGLIVAMKDKDVENKTAAVFAQVFAGAAARWRKDAHTEATVNVSAYGKTTHVRVSFAQKVLDNKGGVMGIKPITDGRVYQAFFKKVQESIYLQEQKVS